MAGRSAGSVGTVIGSRAVQVGFLIGAVALWHVATARGSVSPLLLPRPNAVLRELVDVLATGEFLGDLGVTLGELAAAFALSSITGLTAGYLISRSRYWIEVFEPLSGFPTAVITLEGDGEGMMLSAGDGDAVCVGRGDADAFGVEDAFGVVFAVGAGVLE